jgi:hypothetical protein
MFFLVENDVTDEERDREMAMALQKQLYYQDAKQQVWILQIFALHDFIEGADT